jgi:hypothetical protein
MIGPQERLSAGNGMFIIDDTSAHTNLDYYLIVPREDTVISVCQGEDAQGNAIDFKTVNNWDGTVTSTDLLSVATTHKITAITLTSGSIQCF